MEKREYEASYQLESSYWWFKGQREILIDSIKQSQPTISGPILDAGCGTGKNLETITQVLSRNSVGFDISEWALPFLQQRDLTNRVCQASINEIPFPDDHFEISYSLGVFECEEVDEEQAFSEIWRVTQPGGLILMIVSAYEWLLAPHDKPIHAVRRYNRKSVTKLITSKPVQIQRISNLYPVLFPLVVASRLINRWTDSTEDMPQESDLHPLPNLLNQILYQIVNIERYLLRHVDFPFGSSLLAIVRKE